MERNVQKLICHHISKYYPNVVFTSDQSGLRVNVKQRRALKPLKSSRGIPDLIILHPASGYHGLVMEIKSDDLVVFRADGRLVKNDHIREQYDMIIKLRLIGYAAFFVRGLDAGLSLIEKYLSNELPLYAITRSDPSVDDTTTEWCGRLKLEILGLK